ncbi:hypothetical protein H0W91_03635 [Patescibacteria group bacterium]|nr:hypothetical protein [Patescibacteria group bacterium]
MHYWKKMLMVALVAISASGCAVPLKNGLMMYVGGLSQRVIINHNLHMPADVFVDGQFQETMGVGGTVIVPLPWDMLSNIIVTVKVFEVIGGQKVYRGVDTETFYPRSGTNQNQHWTFNSFQPVQ